MKREKQNQNSYHTNTAWNKKKRVISYVILLFVFVSGIGGLIYKKFVKEEPIHQAQVTSTENTIPGWWLKDYFAKSVCDLPYCEADADPDEDKLTNHQEYFYHSNPLDEDTNKNGVSDGKDVAHGYDPSRPDKTSFEDLLSEDHIIGESLVYDTDIRQMINESVDPNRLTLPQIEDSEIVIGTDDSEQAAIDYVTGVRIITQKYFSQTSEVSVEAAVKSRNNLSLSEYEKLLVQANQEFKKLSVPPDFVQFHKYLISLMNVVTEIMYIPDASVLESNFSEIGNHWFDQTQVAFVLSQKMDLELNRLEEKYRNE